MRGKPEELTPGNKIGCAFVLFGWPFLVYAYVMLRMHDREVWLSARTIIPSSLLGILLGVLIVFILFQIHSGLWKRTSSPALGGALTAAGAAALVYGLDRLAFGGHKHDLVAHLRTGTFWVRSSDDIYQGGGDAADMIVSANVQLLIGLFGIFAAYTALFALARSPATAGGQKCRSTRGGCECARGRTPSLAPSRGAVTRRALARCNFSM